MDRRRYYKGYRWPALSLVGLLALICLPGSARPFDRDSVHAARLIDTGSRAAPMAAAGPRLSASSAIANYLISESTSPARFTQDYAAVARYPDGGWIVAWQDNRWGAQKIILQRLDDAGALVGDNLTIAGSASGANYVEPQLAVDNPGRVHLYYRDRTNGLLFGRRYDSDLNPLAAAFLVNDTSLSSFAGPYDIACYPDGRTVVVWEDYTPLGSTIAMRIYTASGSSALGPVTVNSGGSGAAHWVPAVSVEPSAGCLVTWEDYRNGPADIFARLFAGDGSPLGSDFIVVPPPANNSDQYAPQVCFAGDGNYLIGWIDRRSGQEVYCQRYDTDVGLVGQNQLVSSGDMMTVNWDVTVAADPDYRLTASWASFAQTNTILARRIGSDFSPSGSPITQNISTVGQRWHPAITFDTPDRYGLTWTEFSGADADIHFMSLDSTGNRLLPDEVLLNDDSVGAPSAEPVIVPTSGSWNLVAFTDRRNDVGDIYMQMISNTGTLSGNNVRLNQDAGAALQSQPAAAARLADRALVVWNDSRTLSGLSGQRIYGRYCSVSGGPTTDEFLISGSDRIDAKSEPAVAVLSGGDALVVWIESSDGSRQVFGRWIESDGSLAVPVFAVSDPSTDPLSHLQVAYTGSGRLLVSWLRAAAPPLATARWYAADRTPDVIQTWQPNPAQMSIAEMSVAINGAEDIFAAMTMASASAGLYYLSFSGGSLSLPDMVTVLDVSDAGPSHPSLSVDDADFAAITWIDRRDGNPLGRFQIFRPDLTPIGPNLPLADAAPEFMQTPAVTARDDQAWFVWADPRENGLNIYAGDYLYSQTDVDDDDPSILPTDFYLSQNYPNPFNPSTTIRFSLPHRSDVHLEIFDLLGRRVLDILTGELPAGEHEVTWDGADRSGNPVASGVYFYRLRAGDFTDERKMLLLK